MDLRDELQREHSKAQIQRLAEWIGNDTDRFAILMDLFLHDESRVTQRSSWLVGHCTDRHPALIRPYIPQMIANLKKPGIHDAVRRNTVRIFQDLDIPEENQGELVDICFTYLSDPKVPVAIRVFSMTAIWNICQKQPELKEELALVIEDHMEYGSAGFRSRGKKILTLIYG